MISNLNLTLNKTFSPRQALEEAIYIAKFLKAGTAGIIEQGFNDKEKADVAYGCELVADYMISLLEIHNTELEEIAKQLREEDSK